VIQGILSAQTVRWCTGQPIAHSAGNLSTRMRRAIKSGRMASRIVLKIRLPWLD